MENTGFPCSSFPSPAIEWGFEVPPARFVHGFVMSFWCPPINIEYAPSLQCTYWSKGRGVSGGKDQMGYNMSINCPGVIRVELSIFLKSDNGFRSPPFNGSSSHQPPSFTFPFPLGYLVHISNEGYRLFSCSCSVIQLLLKLHNLNGHSFARVVSKEPSFWALVSTCSCHQRWYLPTLDTVFSITLFCFIFYSFWFFQVPGPSPMILAFALYVQII